MTKKNEFSKWSFHQHRYSVKMGLQWNHIGCFNLHQNWNLHTLTKWNIIATSINGVFRTMTQCHWYQISPVLGRLIFFQTWPVSWTRRSLILALMKLSPFMSWEVLCQCLALQSMWNNSYQTVFTILYIFFHILNYTWFIWSYFPSKISLHFVEDLETSLHLQDH